MKKETSKDGYRLWSQEIPFYLYIILFWKNLRHTRCYKTVKIILWIPSPCFPEDHILLIHSHSTLQTQLSQQYLTEHKDSVPAAVLRVLMLTPLIIMSNLGSTHSSPHLNMSQSTKRFDKPCLAMIQTPSPTGSRIYALKHSTTLVSAPTPAPCCHSICTEVCTNKPVIGMFLMLQKSTFIISVMSGPTDSFLKQLYRDMKGIIFWLHKIRDLKAKKLSRKYSSKKDGNGIYLHT